MTISTTTPTPATLAGMLARTAAKRVVLPMAVRHEYCGQGAACVGPACVAHTGKTARKRGL